jgi:endonuclease I
MLYSRRSEPKGNQDDGSNEPDNWNREHVYAKSHGDFGTNLGPGTDLHALRAADKSVNTERSAKDFADGGSQLSSAEPRDDCPSCLETSDSFEPPDEVKGDVARMIFYMAVRYNGDSDSNGVTLSVVNGVGTPFGRSTTDNGQIGDLASLKAWHASDPVSDEERHRNNLIYDIQGNRNPFIDNPQFVNTIF